MSGQNHQQNPQHAHPGQRDDRSKESQQMRDERERGERDEEKKRPGDHESHGGKHGR